MHIGKIRKFVLIAVRISKSVLFTTRSSKFVLRSDSSDLKLNIYEVSYLAKAI